MTAAERILIAAAALVYAQSHFTFAVGPAVACDMDGDGIRVVIIDGMRRVLLDETFASVEDAVARFQPVKQLSLF